MKKLLAFALITIAFSACKKEEQKPDGPEQWAVGYWQMTELDVVGNVVVGGTAIPITGSGSNYTGGFDLKSDKTATYDAACDVTLNIPGVGPQTVPFERIGNGTWKLINSNTALEVTEGGGTTTIFPIKVITKNILILEQDSTFNMGGIAGSINYEVTLEK